MWVTTSSTVWLGWRGTSNASKRPSPDATPPGPVLRHTETLIVPLPACGVDWSIVELPDR
jgi:hypothetical protein